MTVVKVIVCFCDDMPNYVVEFTSRGAAAQTLSGWIQDQGITMQTPEGLDYVPMHRVALIQRVNL